MEEGSAIENQIKKWVLLLSIITFDSNREHMIIFKMDLKETAIISYYQLLSYIIKTLCFNDMYLYIVFFNLFFFSQLNQFLNMITINLLIILILTMMLIIDISRHYVLIIILIISIVTMTIPIIIIRIQVVLK